MTTTKNIKVKRKTIDIQVILALGCHHNPQPLPINNISSTKQHISNLLLYGSHTMRSCAALFTSVTGQRCQTFLLRHRQQQQRYVLYDDANFLHNMIRHRRTFSLLTVPLTIVTGRRNVGIGNSTTCSSRCQVRIPSYLWNSRPILQQLPHVSTIRIQYRNIVSKKILRVKQARMAREEAALKLIDVPYVLEQEDYVYITTVPKANEWATHTMEHVLLKHINAKNNIFMGVHVLWCTPPTLPPLSDTKNHKKSHNSHKNSNTNTITSNNIYDTKNASKRIAILQLSIRNTTVAVFHLTAMMANHASQSNSSSTITTGSNDDSDDDDVDVDQSDINNGRNYEHLSWKDIHNFQFPIQLKKLLELSNVVICAIRANDLVNELYYHENIDCRTRVDVVDLANKALSYDDGSCGHLIYEPTPSSNVRAWNQSTTLSPPEILDHLCDYFLTEPHHDIAKTFQRPKDDHDLDYITFPPKQLMSDTIVKYYAAHVYHVRLLAAILMDMVSEGEEQFIHEENDDLVYMLDPNYMFHPTIDQRPEPLCVHRRVAILMTDDEYESFIVEGGNIGHPTKDPRRSEIDELKMTRSYSRKILAIGTIDFMGEPFGILRRLYNTSYLVGTDMYEDEAIVKLQRVKHPQFPILPLGCGDEMYWKCKFHSHDESENEASNHWPDEPTLGWVYQNASLPYIIVDQSRLVLFNKQEIRDPNHKPWLGQKKNADLLPELPDDILEHI